MLFLPLFLLCMVPLPLLLALAVGLLVVARRAPRCSTMLGMLALAELFMVSMRVGGMSLSARPSFGEWVRVVDPSFEWLLLCATALLFVAVLAFSLRAGAESVALQLPGHAFILACLGAGSMLLARAPGHEWARPWRAPDGSCEVRMIPYAFVDINGDVVFRNQGDWWWTHAGSVGDELTFTQHCAFEWSADSRSVDLVLSGSSAGPSRRRFVRQGEVLTEVEKRVVKVIDEAGGQEMLANDPTIFIALDYYSGTSSNAWHPWRMTINREGDVQVAVQNGTTLRTLQRRRLDADEVRQLQALIDQEMLADNKVPSIYELHIEGDGESFILGARRGGRDVSITLDAVVAERRSTDAGVSRTCDFLRRLLSMVAPPDEKQSTQLFRRTSSN